MKTMREIIQTGSVAGPYSPAIVVSGSKFIFLSGQIATSLDTDIGTQTQQIMKKIEAL
jgi:enamine deaminase RidA (YjgF/YER057c/UK114 family)